MSERMLYTLFRLSLPVEHRLPQITLLHLELCSMLPPPSSSSCTCILLSTSPRPDLSSRLCSLVVLFLCGHVESTGVLAWQCCRHTSLQCALAKSTCSSSPILQRYLGRNIKGNRCGCVDIVVCLTVISETIVDTF